MFHALENRRLLASAELTPDGILEIIGDPEVDNGIELWSGNDTQRIVISLNGDPNQSFLRDAVVMVRVTGSNGDDRITVRRPNQFAENDPDRLFQVPIKIRGRGGDDTIRGGWANDTIFGGGSRDDISGQGGDDIIFGGSGNDSLMGEAGRDELVGEGDDDHLFGGSGRDSVFGGRGNDLIIGGSGTDSLFYFGGGMDVTLLWDSEEDDDIIRGDNDGMVTFMPIDGIGGCKEGTNPTCDVILGR